ncbi:MAG: maltose ABC transporter permease MalF [Comamonadaceae bacterium]|nr:maltose ABC transporter permease MalF [Comamonadaceae bacterium]
MATSDAASARDSKHWLKWGLLGLIGLLNAYAVVVMYAQGETIFALVTLVLVATGLYVFASEKAYVYRYIFPGVATMFIFIIFPLAYTLWIAFTNYSASNILTFERARDYQLAQTYRLEGGDYEFALYGAGGDRYRLALTSGDGQRFLSQPVEMRKPDAQAKTGQTEAPVEVKLEAVQQFPDQKPLEIGDVIKIRGVLQNVIAHLPDGTDLRMSGMRNFSALRPLYKLLPTAQGGDGMILVNQQTGERIAPDFKTGFYRAINEQGDFVGKSLAPGFSVFLGWQNFIRVLTDPGIQGPFLQIFGWTLLFSFLSVVFTLAIGMVLATLVQWEELKGRGLYRLLLILPYAVPAFISILIFRGLFNQNFGELNLMLNAVFGIKPEWFSDPFLAKVMILIVNTWLGYPYMMILCMGLLKAIPADLYEASAMDGAGFIRNFFSITAPLLMKPLAPLLIASFAFNFNNFVLIQLLTNGRPDIIGATTPAGTTDLLVTYTYRIAFEGSGQDYGLASAIATLIFLMVGALALVNLKLMRVDRASRRVRKWRWWNPKT